MVRYCSINLKAKPAFVLAVGNDVDITGLFTTLS